MLWVRLVVEHPAVRILGVLGVLAGMLTDTQWLLLGGALILALGLLIGRLMR